MPRQLRASVNHDPAVPPAHVHDVSGDRDVTLHFVVDVDVDHTSAASAAARIVDAVRRNRTETVVGSEAKRLLLFNRYFPRLTNWLIARKVKKLYS